MTWLNLVRYAGFSAAASSLQSQAAQVFSVMTISIARPRIGHA